MTSKVLKTINDYQMMSGCETLGIGLSGGADSICLAHILCKNKEQLGIKVIKGIHIHHGIRGDEADRDLEFSRSFCEKTGIDLAGEVDTIYHKDFDGFNQTDTAHRY